MRHGSLFSGIGGFDLAAQSMGWTNVFHCEWAEFPRQILHYYWPEAISYEDIKQTDFSAHRGTIDILTGGFPCQPYSAAGKRKGNEDERHLWPEMLRAIREIQPRWIVGENVFGLITWNGGMVFNEVQADLEAEGYEVQTFILPACAVNAPHRRDRVWIVAYSVSTGTRHQEHPSCNQEWGTCGNREKSLRQTHGTPSASGANATSANDAFAPYSESLGLGEGQREAGRERSERQQQGSQVRCSSATISQERIASDTDNTGDSTLRGGTDANWAQESEQWQQSFSELSRPCDVGPTSDTNVHGCYERDSNNEINTGKRGQYAQRDTKQGNEHGYSANTGSERLQGSIQAGINAKQNRHIRSIKAISQHLSSDGSRIQFQDFPTQSPICGGNDGVPTELDGITVSKWRRESIKGYGNAIVPQVALNIFKAIEQYEQTINKENL